MSEQISDVQTVPEGKPSGAAGVQDAHTGNLENASQADLIKYVKSLREESRGARKARESAEAERLTALEASGDWKKLAEERHGLLSKSAESIADLTSKLESTAAKAKKWEAYEKAETARIAEAAKDLSDDDRAILDGIGDLTLRSRTLQRLIGTETQTHKEPKHPPPSGGDGKDVDVPSLIKQGWSAERLRSTHPEAYEAYLDAPTHRSTTALGDLILQRNQR